MMRSVGVARDGVDGEVAPRQVLFQRHVRRGIDLEALVAARRLALGARQRIFFVRRGCRNTGKSLPTGL